MSSSISRAMPKDRGRESAPGQISFGTLVLIGIACAVCVANNYYSQPLLIEIASDLGISKSLVGVAPTLTQLGIAFGMLFLLPLGDRIENRHIVASLLTLQAGALAVMAAASFPAVYLLACCVAGLCGIVTYLLPAYATRLVPAEQRGAVTGALATGILTGIMLGRSLAGIAAVSIGWRGVFAAAALATLLMAGAMARSMPRTPHLHHQSYRDLLRSLSALTRQSSLLRRATFLQALSFGSFNALWVGLTLHLQTAPFNLDTRTIGELALVAVTSAVAAPALGRLADRTSVPRSLAFAFAMTAAGWIALLILPFSYVGIVAGMVLIGIGALGSDITLRTALYGLAPNIRMRLNSVFSTGIFMGGSFFSLITPLLWTHFGWSAVAISGLVATLICFAMLGGGGLAQGRSDPL